MDISDLYNYLHFKQELVSRCLKFRSKLNPVERKKLSAMLRDLNNSEKNLDWICEQVYYFTICTTKTTNEIDC